MDRERLYNLSLEQKEADSIRITRETLERFSTNRVTTTFIGGKESLTLLHLYQACMLGRGIGLGDLDRSIIH